MRGLGSVWGLTMDTGTFTDQEIYVLEKGEITCSDVEAMLYDYTEGELPESVRMRLDDHIQACPECGELVDTYQLTVDLAKTLAPAKFSKGLQERLRSALNQRLGINLPTAATHKEE